MRVLSWNLKHGRAEPSAGRELFDEFAAALAAWEWDVALLQEVPPWWPAPLGERCAAAAERVLTSRNALLPVRRAVAVRWPDLIKSNGGGANAMLVRGRSPSEHRVQRLCRWPERRWVHALRVAGGVFGTGVWLANLHATAHDTAAAVRDDARAARVAAAWAGAGPCVLGGDFNLRTLELEGFDHAGGHDVDHIFVRGLRSTAAVEVLERGRLSDHAPVRATVAIGPA